MPDPNDEVGAPVQSCPLKNKPKPAQWIEIEMVGEDNQPVPFVQYRVTLPSGEIVLGYLDGEGYARLDQIDPPGSCAIVFPELDKDTWQYIATEGPRSGPGS